MIRSTILCLSLLVSGCAFSHDEQGAGSPDSYGVDAISVDWGLGDQDSTNPDTFTESEASVDAAPEVSVEDTKPTCPGGARVLAMTTGASYGVAGSLYSDTLYDGTKKPASWKPRALVAKVVDEAGAPVKDCEVRWEASSGWVSPDAKTTAADGTVRAFWTAGAPGAATLEASIGSSKAVFEGTSAVNKTRADSIHLSYSTKSGWDRFDVDVTPMKFPGTTYFSTVNWDGAYTGIQNTGPGNVDGAPSDPTKKKLIFSVWDSGGVSAVLLDKEDSACTTFGGEGTGVHCDVANYPWTTGGTYRFEVIIVRRDDLGRSDYSVRVTDLSTMKVTRLGTIRYGKAVWGSGASAFVEDYASDMPSCLATLQRTVAFHHVREHVVGGDWIDVKKASFSRVFLPGNNEVCANYDHFVEGDRFVMSSGGTRVGLPVESALHVATMTLP